MTTEHEPRYPIRQPDIHRDEWWTIEEVMAYLRLSHSTVYNLMTAKLLPYQKFPGLSARRIHTRDVRAFEAGQTPGLRVVQ